ncbi:hypothetical protein MMC12_005296 [Toensbergia leucococca]|nr:hypothetical protein [Toensbergia leucococca]
MLNLLLVHLSSLTSSSPAGMTTKGDAAKKSKQAKTRGQKTNDASLQRQMTFPIELQQKVLDIFRHTFSDCFDDNLPSTIQHVKQHLFNRDFDKAFGSEDFLHAYALRWSSSRTLAYMDLFCNLPHLSHIFQSITRLTSLDSGKLEQPSVCSDQDPPDAHVDSEFNSVAKANPASSNRITCLGGGAGAEIIAIAGYLHYLRNSTHAGDAVAFNHQTTSESIASLRNSPQSIAVTAIDIADWSEVVHKLYGGATTIPSLSKYASSMSKAASFALIDPSLYKVYFQRDDVLNIQLERLAEAVKETALVTFMFTLNELYNTSITRTTNLLLTLTLLLEPGTLLLVVDSPGSYSTVSIGKSSDAEHAPTEKKYPMQWLLDHTLLEASTIGSSARSSQGGQWEKLDSYDSKWFRSPKGLKYPIEIEDVRYQAHLYRHL